jgi:hypothetical protein
MDGGPTISIPARTRCPRTQTTTTHTRRPLSENEYADCLLHPQLFFKFTVTAPKTFDKHQVNSWMAGL